jgi:pyruvate kinase
MRKTKIICTLGPAIDDYDKLKDMVLHGLNCCRLNFSHGTHEEHKVRIDRIKKLRDELDIALPIMLDTKGPEIRVRDFKDGIQNLKEGQTFTLTPDLGVDGDNTKVGLTYPDLSLYVKEGNHILVDDGSIDLEVIKIDGKNIVTKVLNDGVIKNHKSINIPNVIVDMPYLSEADKSDIIFGCEQGVDYIAASFTRRKQDVIDLRNLLDSHDGKNIKIICKIENTEGVEKIDEILEVADGIMVARGDMGVEIPFKYLPAIQKDLISRCYRCGKIVVTATQMLDSMQHSPRPTRAEVSDVANAIYDRTSAIMLSGESAAGKYPIESVSAMSDIAHTTEKDINYQERYYRNSLNLGSDVLSTICNSAVAASFQINAKAIVCVTMHGITAQCLSSYRPDCPIIAVTVDRKAYHQLGLAWNVFPVKAEVKHSTDELFLYAAQKAKETGLVQNGDKIIIMGGAIIGCGITDTIKIHTVK